MGGWEKLFVTTFAPHKFLVNTKNIFTHTVHTTPFTPTPFTPTPFTPTPFTQTPFTQTPFTTTLLLLLPVGPSVLDRDAVSH